MDGWMNGCKSGWNAAADSSRCHASHNDTHALPCLRPHPLLIRIRILIRVRIRIRIRIRIRTRFGCQCSSVCICIAGAVNGTAIGDATGSQCDSQFQFQLKWFQWPSNNKSSRGNVVNYACAFGNSSPTAVRHEPDEFAHVDWLRQTDGCYFNWLQLLFSCQSTQRHQFRPSWELSSAVRLQELRLRLDTSNHC